MNKKVIPRLARNIIIAILSVGWIIPTIQFLIIFLQWQIYLDEELPSDFSHLRKVGNDFFFRVSLIFFMIAAIWLAVVIIFWTIVAANKLWPIRGKQDRQTNFS